MPSCSPRGLGSVQVVIRDEEPKPAATCGSFASLWYAISKGRFEIVKFLFSQDKALNLDGLADVNIAARSCDSGMTKRLLAFPQVRSTTGWIDDYERSYAMDKAASAGLLEIVKWLHENHSEGCTTDAMGFAASGGHLEMVQWLHAHRPEGCTALAMDIAANKGHSHIVQWPHENRSEGCTTGAMDGAASFRMVQWLHENRTEGCTVTATTNAASRGYFEILIFLHANRSEGCSEDTAFSAIVNNNLEISKWAYTNYSERVDLNAIAVRRATRTEHYGGPLDPNKYVLTLVEQLRSQEQKYAVGTINTNSRKLLVRIGFVLFTQDFANEQRLRHCCLHLVKLSL